MILVACCVFGMIGLAVGLVIGAAVGKLATEDLNRENEGLRLRVQVLRAQIDVLRGR